MPSRRDALHLSWRSFRSGGARLLFDPRDAEHLQVVQADEAAILAAQPGRLNVALTQTPVVVDEDESDDALGVQPRLVVLAHGTHPRYAPARELVVEVPPAHRDLPSPRCSAALPPDPPTRACPGSYRFRNSRGGSSLAPTLSS